MSSMSGKKYGLIIPDAKKKIFGRKAPLLASRPNVFGNDSSSDEDAHKEVNAQIHKEALKKIVKKQTQIEIQKALEQDSSVFEYDSIYDDLKEQNKVKIPDNVAKADKQKKPKYIAKLLQAADLRTKERERREERKIQKERENEGDEFSDKPEFVTSAYKAKMQERQEEIEKEKRMDVIEEALDVKKQKDLSGFYRHFLNQQTGEEKIKELDQEEIGEKDVAAEHDEDRDTDLSFSSDESDVEDDDKQDKKRDAEEEHEIPSGEKHRQREISSSSDGEEQPLQRQTNMSSDDERRIRYCDERTEKKNRSNEDNSRTKRTDRHDRRRHHRSRERDHHRLTSHSPDSHRDKYRHSRRRSRSRSPHRRRDEGRRTVDKKRSKRSQSKERRHRKDSKDRKKNESFPDKTDRTKIEKPQIEKMEQERIVGPQPESTTKSLFVRRTDKNAALSAKERYLARKVARTKQPVVEPDSD